MGSFKSFIKVACRVRIWKKTFCQNSDKFGCSFIKNGIMFMYVLYIYTKPTILSLFKVDTLNFTTYIFANLICPLKTYVRLHNLISMNIFFAIKDRSFSLAFFRKTNRSQKSFFKQTSLNPILMNIFFTIRDYIVFLSNCKRDT